MRVLEGGSGSPVLLLLHGLGATSDVWEPWRPMLARRWPGRWLAPDLPGHGGSPGLPNYTFESFATSVAGLLDGADEVTVLGHSLGGVVGLTLAGNGYDVPMTTVVGLGIKVVWTAEELDRARAMAQRPVTRFSSYEEAATRHLRVSGLSDLLDNDHPAVRAGLCQEQGRWRLALDPHAFAVGAPDMPRLVAESRARVILARGEHDAMNTDADLARLAAVTAVTAATASLAPPAMSTVTLADLGHNAHVESPEAVFGLLGR